MSVQRCMSGAREIPVIAVWCRELPGVWDINNNRFILLHRAKCEVQARSVHGITNTTETGWAWSGMSTISQKLSTQKKTSLNNKLNTGLQLRPRLNTKNQTSEILYLKLKEHLALSYMEGCCYPSSYFHLRSWMYFILCERLLENSSIILNFVESKQMYG